MEPISTQRLLDFLCCAASYPHAPDHVTLIQTHASWVFMAPPFVYKVKKPVCFGFLDFTTLESRHANCDREVALNRRLAPDLYLDVEGIRETDGSLHFGGEGEIVEWAVKMHEMDRRYFLSHRVRENAVGADEIDRVVERLTQFYDSETALSDDAMAAAAKQTLGNIFSNLAYAEDHVGRSLSAESCHAITTYSHEFARANSELLESRILEGRFRDCHGDLHLEHIYLGPDGLRIYDCIEFSDRFRFIDIACDIAFLAMDLEFNHRRDLATHLVQRCASELRDEGLLKLMDFYKCYRACVRGKVESLRSVGDGIDDREADAALELAQRYYHLALRYALIGSKPKALVTMGGVASGKSTLAHELGNELGWPVYSSDEIRKELGGVPLCERGDVQQRATLYSEEMTDRVYATMLEKACQALQAGEGVILDATYSSRSYRDKLQGTLGHEGFEAQWIEVFVENEIALARLKQRETMSGVISDARAEDSASLNARYEPPTEMGPRACVSIRAETATSATLHLLMEKLARRQARVEGIATEGTCGGAKLAPFIAISAESAVGMRGR